MGDQAYRKKNKQRQRHIGIYVSVDVIGVNNNPRNGKDIGLKGYHAVFFQSVTSEIYLKEGVYLQSER